LIELAEINTPLLPLTQPVKDAQYTKENLMLKKTLILSILMLLLSLSFAFVLAEMLIRYASPQVTLKQAKQLSLRLFAESKFLPYEIIPNYKTRHIGHTFEFDYEITTNSLGLRGKEINKNKEPGVYRILMLGDSSTFGWGVKDNESFPAQLEANLKEKLKVKNKGFDLNPDLVVVNLFVRNDVFDLYETVWEETDDLGYPLKISSKYRRLKDGFFAYIDGDWKLNIPLLNNSHLAMLTLTVMETKTEKIANLIKKTVSKTPQSSDRISETDIQDCLYRNKKCPSELEEKYEKLKLALQAIKHISQENGVQLITILIPDSYQLSSVKADVMKKDKYAFIDADYDIKVSVPDVLNQAQPQKKFRQILEEEAIEYQDILPDLVINDPQSLFFHSDGHYRKEGNTKIAEAISNYLIENYELVNQARNE
jgi:hypothetical protein